MAFKIAGKTVFLCDCSQSMHLDEAYLARTLNGEGDVRVHHELCSGELAELEHGLAGSDAIIACTQEAAVFSSLVEDAESTPAVVHLNIREYAAWGEEAEKSGPKIAALIEAAVVEVRPPDPVTMNSDGRTLVYGKDEVALEAAAQLSNRLDVTLLLYEAPDLPPPSAPEFKIFGGRVQQVIGHLGAFRVEVDEYREKDPSARTSLSFDSVLEKVELQFDLILDLSGGTPLFQDGERRDGYFRVDPGASIKVQRTLFELVDLVGTFDKPRYVSQEVDLCVHSRNKQIGCSRCLDNCPTSSIVSANDAVEVDEFACAGCGQCASVCPTGSLSYAVPPPVSQCEVFRRLLAKYLVVGGDDPVLLLHDSTMVEALLAIGRFGRGLPANVIPWDVGRVTSLGLDVILAAITYGAGKVAIAVGETRVEELHALRGHLELVDVIFNGLDLETGLAVLVEERDPTQLEETLYQFAADARGADQRVADKALRLGGKRDRMWSGLNYLKEIGTVPAMPISLPASAPFGNIKLDESKCTLCLACVSVCPEGALLDNQDKPQVSFLEQSCVQCGLCRVTCPEGAISLEPRLDLTEAARAPRLLMEEDPFSCVRCGKAFGVSSSIEKMVSKLKDHPMFKNNEAAIDRIRMCEDCRVVDQFSDKQVFAVGTRPRTRTSDDYSEDS